MAKKPAKPRTSAANSPTSQKPTKAQRPRPSPAAAVHTSKYAVGDHVSHPIFGEGKVTTIDGEKLTIQFLNNVVKQIIEGYVTHRKL